MSTTSLRPHPGPGSPPHPRRHPGRTWARVAGGAALLVLVTGACTGDEPPGEVDPTGAGAAVPGATTPAPGDRAPTLANLLGVGGTPEEVAQQISATEQTRQALVRDCMVRQGFEYVPHVTAGEIVDPSGLPTDLSAEQFRRQYGYGIATGFENALGLKPVESNEDPNRAIVDAMSEPERAAYQLAMHGSGADGDGDDPAGCQGQAAAATDRYGTVIEEFGDQLADLNARVTADSRVVAAQRAWADCLAQAGHRFADQAGIQAEVTRRMNPLYDAMSGDDIPEGMSVVVRDRALTPDQSALLATVRSFELAVANADQDCRDATELDQVRTDVRDEYDARFVDEHRGRLRELFPGADL